MTDLTIYSTGLKSGLLGDKSLGSIKFGATAFSNLTVHDAPAHCFAENLVTLAQYLQGKVCTLTAIISKLCV